MDNLLFFANFVGLIALIPLDPLGPHLVNFFPFELSCYAEPGYCINVRVKLSPMLKMGKLFVENLNDQLLLVLHLGQLAIGYVEWVIALHYSIAVN